MLSSPPKHSLDSSIHAKSLQIGTFHIHFLPYCSPRKSLRNRHQFTRLIYSSQAHSDLTNQLRSNYRANTYSLKYHCLANYRTRPVLAALVIRFPSGHLCCLYPRYLHPRGPKLALIFARCNTNTFVRPLPREVSPSSRTGSDAMPAKKTRRGYRKLALQRALIPGKSRRHCPNTVNHPHCWDGQSVASTSSSEGDSPSFCNGDMAPLWRQSFTVVPTNHLLIFRENRWFRN